MVPIILTLILSFFTPISAQSQSSTTFAWGPICGPIQGRNDSNHPFFGASNTLSCVDYIPCHGITDATKALIITQGASMGTGGTFGFAIYNADGSTQLGEDSVAYSVSDEPVEFTFGSPISLTAGTQYRVCWCSSSDQGGFTGYLTGNIDDLLNAHATHLGTAANPCTGSADPPATTGALTANNVNLLIFLLSTDTP